MEFNDEWLLLLLIRKVIVAAPNQKVREDERKQGAPRSAPPRHGIVRRLVHGRH